MPHFGRQFLSLGADLFVVDKFQFLVAFHAGLEALVASDEA